MTTDTPMRRSVFGVRRSMATAAAVAVASAALAACGSGSSVNAGSAPVGAASYLPAGSVAYFEASTDLDSVQWQTALDLANRFPGFTKVLDDAKKGLAKDGADFERDIRPLLGDSAAGALVRVTAADLSNRSKGSTPPMVVAVEIVAGQEAKIEGLLAKSAGTKLERVGEFEGATIYRDSSDDRSWAAVTDGALLMATDETTLKGALTAHANGATMANSERLKESLAMLPEDTIAQGFIDMAAFVNVLKQTDQAAMIKQLDAAGIGPNAALGMSVTAEQGGVRIKAVSTDITGQRLSSFTPTFTAHVPANALAFFNASNLFDGIQPALTSMMAQDESFKSSLLQARGALALIGVSVDDLKTLTSGESAVAVTPGAVPGVVAILGTADGAAAGAILDRVRSGITTFAGGKVPPFKPVQLANGVSGWESKIDPKASLIYGVQGNDALIGSSVDAVRLVQSPKVPLSDDAAFREATSQMPGKVEQLMWVNGSGLWDTLDALGQFKTAPKEALANLRPIKNMALWYSDGGQQMEAFVTIK